MGTSGRAFARAVMIATAVAMTAASAACGNATADNGKITLVVKTFSTFGYEELYKQYEKDHPNITIKEENIAKLGDYEPKLQQWITAGSGAGDIVALEEGVLVKYLGKPDKFVNLLDHGASELKSKFLDWKWQQALTADGKKLVGLGTDVGAQGMCYRVDKFRKAGLPTNRDEVGALWPTWEQYAATGKRFAAANSATNSGANSGAKFFDSAGGVYQNMLMQEGDHTYFDKSNKLVIEANPGVRKAWNATVDMVRQGLSANLQMWGPQWNAGFKSGAFATIPCPAWMLGIIEEQAGPENAGTWDVARVPGDGAVRGGSFLAVPTQSKNQKEAAELAKYLTGPQSQIAAFKARTNFPSSPQAIDDPAVTSAVNDYFNNAPVGKIFGTSAKALKPVYLGPDNQKVGDKVGDILVAVEQGKLKPEEAWARAVDEAKRATKP